MKQLSPYFLILSVVGACAIGASGLFAATVAEHELLLRNTLYINRKDEVVVVTLRELGVAGDVALHVKGVEVFDETGRSLVCQFDDFSATTGVSSEVAFETELAPKATQRVVIRLLDTASDTAAACSVRMEGDTVFVTTPEFTAPVRHDKVSGLWVEQPGFIVSETQKQDDVLDAMLMGLHAPVPLAAGAGNLRVSMKPPMSDEGLPFCVQGFPTFGKQERLKAWGGPVRSVVCLEDRGVWATGHAETRCTAVQTVWFPRSGKRFFLDWHAMFEDPVPPGRISFAGLRVNSANFGWDLIMGQDGRRPYVAPVIVPLVNTTKTPYLEPYQKSTFNHVWAQAVSAQGWAAVVVDTVGSHFGTVTNWDTGRVLLNINMSYNDPGPYGNSLQPIAQVTGLPAGEDYHLRAMVVFGGADDAPAEMRAAAGTQSLSRRWRQEPGVEKGIEAMRTTASIYLANPVVPAQPAMVRSETDWSRVRALAAERSVVMVTPDRTAPDRAILWGRLAAQLGGTWHAASSFLKFYNVTSEGRRDPDLLTVVVGEPGTNPLLDQLNHELNLMNAYPLEPPRAVTLLIDETEIEGALLVVAGNTEMATRQAVEQALAQLGTAPPRAAVTISSYPWGDLLPNAWSGLKPHTGAFKMTAYRNGHADFLMVLRTGEALSDVQFQGPTGATTRFVPFRFESVSAGATFVTALHDAAFPTLPATLDAHALYAIWVSLPISADAKPSERRDTATLTWTGGSHEIVLETDVLSLQLPDRPALGFYPMGFDAESIRMYYDWDYRTYLAKLPNLLRQLNEFGPNLYNLEVSGIKISADDEGKVTIDADELKQELNAVRSADSVDVLMIDSLNHLWDRDVLATMMRAHRLADDFEAWEFVIPELRQTLRELDLEDKLVCRHGDEIPDYEGWIGRAELYKRCGVRMSVAINGYGVFNKHLGVGTMGFWIPLYNFYLNRWGNPISDDDVECFSRTFRDERRAADEPIWPYVCGPGPYAWSPRPRSQARYLMLDTYMKGADGLTYYGGMVWSHALDPAFRKHDKADLFDTDATFTTLFYPDAATDSILPSLRAGAFRLGLEDATAVQAVRTRAAAKGRSNEAGLLIEKAIARITMESDDAAFDTLRQVLGRLWRELED